MNVQDLHELTRYVTDYVDSAPGHMQPTHMPQFVQTLAMLNDL